MKTSAKYFGPPVGP